MLQRMSANRFPFYRDSLPVEKWCLVIIRPINKTQFDFVFDSKLELSEAGIYFDSGGGDSELEWEIDFSFHLSKSAE